MKERETNQARDKEFVNEQWLNGYRKEKYINTLKRQDKTFFQILNTI